MRVRRDSQWRFKMTYRFAFPPPPLVLGAMLLVACQDSPVAPPATRPALAVSLLERGESSSETTFDFTTIDVPGASTTGALDINNEGVIVGRYASAGRTHGFVRSTAGELTTIDFPGAGFTVAGALHHPRGGVRGGTPPAPAAAWAVCPPPA